jgi:hypothetical protein
MKYYYGCKVLLKDKQDITRLVDSALIDGTELTVRYKDGSTESCRGRTSKVQPTMNFGPYTLILTTDERGII